MFRCKDSLITGMALLGFIVGCGDASAPGKNAQSETQPAMREERPQRIPAIPRHCEHATFADEPSIADVFAKSDLVIVGSGGLRMYLKESPFATGTDWDKDKWVVEIRIEQVIKGKQSRDSIPVLFAESSDVPLNYATMLVGWRDRAIIFLRSADREGFWELACKEPVDRKSYPGIPTEKAEKGEMAPAASEREKLIRLLSLNVERGSLTSCWQSLKALRDFGALKSVEKQVAACVERALLKEHDESRQAINFLCNVSCLRPELVRLALIDELAKLPDAAEEVLEKSSSCLPGPIPQVAERMIKILESGTPGDHGEALRGLAVHIAPAQADRLVKLYPKLSSWQKGAASAAIVKVLSEKTLPLYLANFRAEDGDMQRYFALQTINTVDGTIDPAIRAHKAAILRELTQCIAKSRGSITTFPNAQMPMAVWRLAQGDPSLPAYSNNTEKDADALLEWWREAETRYR